MTENRGRSLSRSRSVEECSTLSIDRISRNVTALHLIEIFKSYGEIEKIELPLQPSGMHRGRGYITYKTVQAAKKAIACMDRGQIDGLTIDVELDLPSTSPSPNRSRSRSPINKRRARSYSSSPEPNNNRSKLQRKRSNSYSSYSSRSRSRSPPRNNNNNNNQNNSRKY